MDYKSETLDELEKIRGQFQLVTGVIFAYANRKLLNSNICGC